MKRALLLAAVCFTLTGCATAQIAQGPSIASIQERAGEPTVAVAMVEDARGNTRAGTIGATSVDVPATVKNTVHNYLVNTIYDNFKVNIKAGDGASGQKFITSKIASIGIHSIDAILQPTVTDIVLQLVVQDEQGEPIYESEYKGLYEERIGISIVETKTGALIEDATRNLMAQIAGDEKLREALEG